MAYNTKKMLRDADNKLIPQFYDPVSDSYKPINDPTKVQLSGSNPPLETKTKGVISSSNPSQFTGFTTLEIANNWTDNGSHKAFASIVTGKNDEMFLMYRSAPQHDSILPGRLMISKSVDQGETWSNPIQFFKDPDLDFDTKDPSITYDDIEDMFYVCWTRQHKSNTPATLKIYRGKDPMNPTGMTDVSPATQPFTSRNIVCHKVVKYGYYYYLPIYGQDGTGGLYPAIMISTDNGLTWNLFYKFTELQGAEPTMYIKSHANQENGATFYLLVRNYPDAGLPANLYISVDEARTWGRRDSLTVGSVSGGPKVFSMDNYFMLIARDDTGYRHGYISYSLDGENWSKRQPFLNSPPVYPEIAKLKNGRVFILVSQERSMNSCKLQLTEMIKPPLLDDMNKRVLRTLAHKAQLRDTIRTYHPSATNKGGNNFFKASRLPMADVSDLKNFNLTVVNTHDQSVKVEIVYAVRPGLTTAETQHVIVATITMAAGETKRLSTIDYPIFKETPGVLVVYTQAATTAPTTGDITVTLEAERR